MLALLTQISIVTHQLGHNTCRIGLRISLIILIALFLSGCGTSDSDSKETTLIDVQEISKSFDTAMIECPERIWPDYGWDNFQVVLVDRENETAFLWNDLTSMSIIPTEPKVISYLQLPANLKYGSYGYGEWNGYDTMSIAFNNGNQNPVILAFHEGFHYLGQSNWGFPHGIGSREYNYPENYYPRYLRNQIGFSLLNQFIGEDQYGIEKAAYWYQKWVTEYPEELVRFNRVDRTEGSAKYVECLSSAIANIGCWASESDLFSFLSEEIKFNNSFEKAGYYPLAGEPYFLGEISGVLLRRIGKAYWENRIIQGDTPLDIIFEDVEPMIDDDNTIILSNIQDHYENLNEQLRLFIEPLMDSWNSTDFVRVTIPRTWGAGSYIGHGERLQYQNGSENLTISQYITGVYQTSAGELMEVTDLSIIWTAESPCGNFGDSFPLPKAQFDETANNCIVFNDSQISSTGCIEYEVVIGDNGENWVCLK